MRTPRSEPASASRAFAKGPRTSATILAAYHWERRLGPQLQKRGIAVVDVLEGHGGLTPALALYHLGPQLAVLRYGEEVAPNVFAEIASPAHGGGQRAAHGRHRGVEPGLQRAVRLGPRRLEPLLAPIAEQQHQRDRRGERQRRRGRPRQRHPQLLEAVVPERHRLSASGGLRLTREPATLRLERQHGEQKV
jgi:hypothetical protein